MSDVQQTFSIRAVDQRIGAIIFPMSDHFAVLEIVNDDASAADFGRRKVRTITQSIMP